MRNEHDSAAGIAMDAINALQNIAQERANDIRARAGLDGDRKEVEQLHLMDSEVFLLTASEKPTLSSRSAKEDPSADSP